MIIYIMGVCQEAFPGYCADFKKAFLESRKLPKTETVPAIKAKGTKRGKPAVGGRAGVGLGATGEGEQVGPKVGFGVAV